ncbi:MAG: TIGR02270 family protein [Enhygromyxa sp.]
MLRRLRGTTPVTLLLWDIQAEHLDESEFLLELWTTGLDSPRFDLARLANGPERRLLARIDGLRFGGEAVVERLLLPALDDPRLDEFRAAAAGLAIFEFAGQSACERALAALDTITPSARRGMVRALQLTHRDGLIAWLAYKIDKQPHSTIVARLQVFIAHRVDAGSHLIRWLAAEDLELRRAAAVLARHTAAPEVLARLEPLMSDEDDELRWAAIESGLIRGVPRAWPSLCVEVYGRIDDRSNQARRRAALAWLATLGDAGVHERLLDDLQASPSTARIWAAGFCGRPAAVDLALELLDHPTLGRLAGEVVTAIAGLSDADPGCWRDRGLVVGEGEDEALPTLERDDLDADLVPSEDAALRLPDPDEVRFWWAQRRERFDPKLRHLYGRPASVAALAHALEHATMRRRHTLALELAARTRGRAQLATRILAHQQSAQAHAVFTELGELDLHGGLPLLA